MPASVPVCQVEKSLLKTEVEGDVSGVKDIVRAMATVSQMLSVARLLRLLRKMHEEGVIIVLRVKERFLSSPSGSVYGSSRSRSLALERVHIICYDTSKNTVVSTPENGMLVSKNLY